jgi:NAD(P)-dependent dehydrogenase (short-subunit alcohol dehydrogenase family)
MSPVKVLVTGANRGIGLAFVKAFADAGCKVVATVRDLKNANDLQNIKDVLILELDCGSQESIQNFVKNWQMEPLDLLINNAGVFEPENLNHDTMHHVFQVNSGILLLFILVAPLMIFQKLLPRLELSSQPKVINITSRVGSIADNGSGHYIAYRSSKTALNMITKTLSIDFPKISFLALHPGHVQTRMVGFTGHLTPEESVARMINVINDLTLENSGSFMHCDGHVLPW